MLVQDGSASMLIPLVVRPVQGSIMDAESPYGYPGPLVSGTNEPAFVRTAFAAAIPVLAAHDIISVFVRFHPILNTVLPTGPGLVRHGDTVAIDLTQPIGSQWSKIRRGHRENIDRSVRLGHLAYLDTDWDHYDGFKSLYRSTMARVGASSFYDFGDPYFDGLREALGAHLGLAVVIVEGELAAAALITEMSGIVQYHLAGWDVRFGHFQPSKRLIHSVQTWAAERGHRWFHLGGGRGGSGGPSAAVQVRVLGCPIPVPYVSPHHRHVGVRSPHGTHSAIVGPE